MCLLFTYSDGYKISLYHLQSIHVLYFCIKLQSYEYMLQIRNCCREYLAVSYTDEHCYFKLQNNQSWSSRHQEFSAHKVSRAWLFLIYNTWQYLISSPLITNNTRYVPRAWLLPKLKTLASLYLSVKQNFWFYDGARLQLICIEFILLWISIGGSDMDIQTASTWTQNSWDWNWNKGKINRYYTVC